MSSGEGRGLLRNQMRRNEPRYRGKRREEKEGRVLFSHSSPRANFFGSSRSRASPSIRSHFPVKFQFLTLGLCPCKPLMEKREQGTFSPCEQRQKSPNFVADQHAAMPPSRFKGVRRKKKRGRNMFSSKGNERGRELTAREAT